MRFDIITIFPNLFNGFLTESLISRGQKNKLLKINIHNLRKWTTDRHQKVDDKPFGGGPGLVFRVEPIFKAVMALKSQITNHKPSTRAKLGAGLVPHRNEVSGAGSQKNYKSQKNKTRVILFSPRGKKFDQKTAKQLVKYDQLIMICGRYEGVDERVADYIADEVVSIGDYVLSGGEVPAMIVIETISRLIPGVVGKQESVEKFDHPQYTRPEIFKSQITNHKPSTRAKLGAGLVPHRNEVSGAGSQKGVVSKKQIWRVPKVLLSGNHKKITEWRKRHVKT